jgi:uncharacterized protein (UPF0303 family)
LREDNSEWAQKNIKVLLKVSPSSLKITKKAIDEGKKKSLAECLEMEYRLAYTALGENSDFHEGNLISIFNSDSIFLLSSIFSYNFVFESNILISQYNFRCQSSFD